jgi:hypothetical protein
MKTLNKSIMKKIMPDLIIDDLLKPKSDDLSDF